MVRRTATCRAFASAAMMVCCLACGQEPRADPATATPAAPGAGTDAESAPASGPASVTGKVPIVNGVPSIVVLQPQAAQQTQPPAAPPIMDQVALSFIPSMLIVRNGQPTEFWNSDDVLHNVRVAESSTRQGQFNVAIPQGEKYVFTFTRDGYYDVGCDIHPTMTAQIFATSSPFSAVTDTTGQYVIPDVPPGSYTLAAYVGAEKLERPVSVTGGETTADIAR